MVLVSTNSIFVILYSLENINHFITKIFIHNTISSKILLNITHLQKPPQNVGKIFLSKLRSDKHLKTIKQLVIFASIPTVVVSFDLIIMQLSIK